MNATADLFQELPRLILFHRKQARLTQEELAQLAGVGKTVVYDIEHGKATVQINTLLKLLNVLNIRVRFESPLMALFKASQ